MKWRRMRSRTSGAPDKQYSTGQGMNDNLQVSEWLGFIGMDGDTQNWVIF